MGFRLTPHETGFYDLFSNAASHLVEGAGQLTALLAAEGKSERKAIAKRMYEIESEADEAVHRIINKVNTSFITPFDREDIHALAFALDDCVDHMDAAVDLIVLYEVEQFATRIAKQVDVLTRMAALTVEAMPRLRSMKNLADYWVEINRLESQADKQYRRLIADLFNSEDPDPIWVMKNKEIIDELEAAADAFEVVAHKIEGIAVKES